MHPDRPRRPLCTIELIARGHAERCPGEACPYWDNGCILDRVEAELDGRRDVAELLLTVRRDLEAARPAATDDAAAEFRHGRSPESG